MARKRKSPPRLSLEALETKAVPAQMVSAMKMVYQDIDGDDVTVSFTKPVLTAANVNTVFTFNTGTVDGTVNTPQKLFKIDLTSVAAAAQNTGITVGAKPFQGNGDSFTTVGEINAAGIDLALVNIDGDLGRLSAGDATTSTQAAGAITVQSLGRFGLSSGAPDVVSSVNGKVKSLTVKSDVFKATFNVGGGADGQLGALTIKGSLIGGQAANSGRIASSGAMGAVNIDGDIAGGDGIFSGSVAGGSIKSVSVGGSMRAEGQESAQIFSFSTLGPVIVGGDLIGKVNGSGVIEADGNMTGVFVSGSVIGRDGESGVIRSLNGSLGNVTVGVDLVGGPEALSGMIYGKTSLKDVFVGGDVVGGAGADSGHVGTDGPAGKWTVGGALRGGAGEFSGSLQAGGAVAGPVLVVEDVVGDAGASSGLIIGGKLGKVTISGSMFGGTGGNSGQVFSFSSIDGAYLNGDLVGNVDDTGLIEAQGDIGTVSITGSIYGGKTQVGGTGSGVVRSLGGSLGPVLVLNSLVGGAGDNAGIIRADAGSIASLTVGGSVLGGAGARSGNVSSGEIKAVTITGDLKGYTGIDTGEIIGGKIGDVAIGGSVIGGAGGNSGQVFSGSTTGKVTVGGDIVGTGIDTGLVEAQGNIKSVTVGGSVRGGADESGVIRSLAGNLGPVTIGGGLIGGPGALSGLVKANTGSIGVVRITGSIIGGAGQNSGLLNAKGIASLNLGGDITGGTGSGSARVDSGALIPTVNIRGSIRGNAEFSGQLYGDSLGNVSIGGDVVGGAGAGQGFSGYVGANFNIGNLEIKGSIRGGANGQKTGFVEAYQGSMGNLTVRRDLVGGAASASGSVYVGTTLGTSFIGGSLTGGTGGGSGLLSAGGNAGPSMIRGSLVGGSGGGGGGISIGGNLSRIQIDGNIRGGAGYGEGSLNVGGKAGDIVVAGSITGGGGGSSGLVTVNGDVKSFTSRGGIRGGTGGFAGGLDFHANAGPITVGGSVVGGRSSTSGFVAVTGDAGAVTVNGDIAGTDLSGADDFDATGYVYAGRMASLTVNGSLLAGENTTANQALRTGFIEAANDIGTLTISGNVVGRNDKPARITARGSAAPTANSDLAIGRVMIGGRVDNAVIAVGAGTNGDAQIGPVTIGGDFVASSIAAGIGAGPDGYFGSADDVKFNTKDVAGLSSKIGNVTIGGQAKGTVVNVSATDSYGITAEHILGFKVGGAAHAMQAGPVNDAFNFGYTTDFMVREGL